MRSGRIGELPLVAVLAAACGPSAADISVDGGGSADAAQADAGASSSGSRIYVHSGDSLYVVDRGDFSLDLVGAFGVSGITDFAVTPSGGLFAISETTLYSVDPITAKATLVGPVPGKSNVGLTFLPDGKLLATDKSGGVRRVDPQTGAIEEVGSFGGGYGTAGDLVAVADGTMYAISDRGPNGNEAGNNVLLTVNPSTGQMVAPIGQIGFGAVWGCAYAGGHVYAFTNGGDIIEIDRETGGGTLVRSHPDVRFWGAGVTPLVEVE